MVMGVEAAPRPRKTRRPASMMFSGVHHPFPSVRQAKQRNALPAKFMREVLFGLALTKTDDHHLLMIEFLDAQGAFEHYRRVLRRNGPIETRAKYNCDCLHVEHYNAHTGQFIIGAVFTKGTRRNPGSFVGLLSGPAATSKPSAPSAVAAREETSRRPLSRWSGD